MKRYQASKNVETLVFESLGGKVTASGANRSTDFSYFFDQDNASWKTSSANACVQGVVGKAQQVDDITYKVRGDLYLTPIARAQTVAPVRAAFYEAVNRVLDVNLNVESQRIKSALAKLLAVPRPAPEDASGALRQREMRERLSVMDKSSHEFRTINAGIQTGDPAYTELIAALASDPIPNSLAGSARAVWEAQQEATRPVEFAALKQAAEYNDAAISAVRGLAKVMQESERIEIEPAQVQR